MESIILFLCFFLFKASNSFLLNIDPSFSHGTNVGDVTSHYIDEASGLAASRRHAGVMYTHNDKGDSSRIYAISTNDGSLLAVFTIDHAGNYDWEDIAVGMCPGDYTTTCMYIGDIGDHSGDGSKKNIYIVEEPSVIKNSHLQPRSTLHYRWNVLDADTLMVDPRGDVILISTVDGGRGQIGMIPASAFLSSSTYTIRNSTTLRIPHTTSHPNPTAGDISVYGDEVLVRTDKHIYYWSVQNMDYLKTLSSVDPININPHKVHKPEGIAWDRDGVNFFTNSEGDDEPLYKYTRD